jgi:plasmid maintenance system killer protein
LAVRSRANIDLQGFRSVTVTGNWRIIFRFPEGDAYEVDLIETIDGGGP